MTLPLTQPTAIIEAKTPRELYIEWLAVHLNPEYPAAIVEPGGVIDEPADSYLGNGKPKFVTDDDKGWV